MSPVYCELGQLTASSTRVWLCLGETHILQVWSHASQFCFSWSCTSCIVLNYSPVCYMAATFVCISALCLLRESWIMWLLGIWIMAGVYIFQRWASLSKDTSRQGVQSQFVQPYFKKQTQIWAGPGRRWGQCAPLLPNVSLASAGSFRMQHLHICNTLHGLGCCTGQRQGLDCGRSPLMRTGVQ